MQSRNKKSVMKSGKIGFLRLALLALIGVFALSCCKDDEPNGEQRVISFRSKAVDTKAVVESDEVLRELCATGDAIAVFGRVNNAHNTNQAIFNNTPLTYTDGDWSYEDPRYWIRGAKHEFMAVYPYSEVGTAYTWDATTGTITFEEITTGTANNIDVMYASAERDLAANPTDFSRVPLEMHHALALLEFRFVNGSDRPVSSVTNISLDNHLYRSSLAVGQDGTAALTANTSERVGEGSGLFVGELSATNLPIDLSKSYNLFENVGSVVVVPQSVYKQGVMFRLRVGDVSSVVDLGTTGTITEWEAGKRYVYTMTLTTTTITFDVQVIDWIRDEIEL